MSEVGVPFKKGSIDVRNFNVPPTPDISMPNRECIKAK